GGHVVLAPSQVSATSHTSTAARQTAPAFPAGCWQVTLVPLHWSRVQGLVSAVQAVPAALTASGGQVALVPVHVSWTSHSFTVARQTVLDGAKVQLVVQQEPAAPLFAPRSHDSPGSTNPSPHTPALNVAMAAAQLRDGLSVPSAEYAPVALTMRYSELMVLVAAGASATRCPMLTAEFVAVATFVPLAPAAACAASAPSELLEDPVEVSYRSVIPDGGPNVLPLALPKKPTSIALATVVV